MRTTPSGAVRSRRRHRHCRRSPGPPTRCNCTYQHNAGRGTRGENIAANAPAGGWSLQGVVAAWAGEAKDYDYASNTCASGKVCGHYTQLVWRDTLRVGCAHSVCTTNSPFPGQTNWDFWVCDYEPPGNFIGQKPY